MAISVNIISIFTALQITFSCANADYQRSTRLASHETPRTEQRTHNGKRPRDLPGHFYGVTSDDAYDAVDLPQSLAALAKKPVTRLVYDDGVPSRDYLRGTKAVHDVSYVMALPVDSSFAEELGARDYANRFHEYWKTLAPYVDLWEIGNEVNGPWTGKPKDVALKVKGAFDIITAHGGRTALTLHYNTHCAPTVDSEWSNWVTRYLSPNLRNQLDYVFLSYYEEDCPGAWPKWNDVFIKLGKLFPNSKLGIGECGTAIEHRKAQVIYDFYSLSFPGTITAPRFVGGYFYWYFHQDMVPKSKELWKEFNEALKLLP